MYRSSPTHLGRPTSTDTSLMGSLAATSIVRAVLTLTDNRGPRVFFALEVSLFIVLFGCFTNLAWRQIATDVRGEDNIAPLLSQLMHARPTPPPMPPSTRLGRVALSEGDTGGARPIP